MTQKVTVVGAGLVGSLAAIFLARRGFDVEVIERRPDMRREKIAAGRSINLAISARGLYALSKLGLEQKILSLAVPMKKRMMHAVGGELTSQPYGRLESEFINSISRGDLNKVLMTEAEATGRVRFVFDTRLVSLNPDTTRAQLINEKSGETSERDLGRVVATDGAFSAVREALLSSQKIKETTIVEEHGYKELTMPAGANGSFQLDKNSLHIWPRKSFMLIALPNLDGSFTCTLFLAMNGSPSFNELTDKPSVEHFFETYFSDALQKIPDLSAQFFENPVGRLTTVKTMPWHYKDKVVLLGDAAHAIVPFFGQGMNCGFEDVTVFDELLEQHGNDFGAVFARITKLRKDNADAIAQMALENFIEMRDKVGEPSFLLRKQVERELANRFPQLFVPRYTLVTFRRVPYRFAENMGVIQDNILDSLCHGKRTFEDVDFSDVQKKLESALGTEMRRFADL